MRRDRTSKASVDTPSMRGLSVLYARNALTHALRKAPQLQHALTEAQLAYAAQNELDRPCGLQAWHALMAVCELHCPHLITELAAEFKPRQLGLLGQLFMSSGSIGQLVELSIQFQPLLNNVFVLEHAVEDGRACIRLLQTTGERSDRLARLSLLQWSRFARFVGEPGDMNIDARFEGPPPHDALSYRHLLGGVVRFDQSENALFFDARKLWEPAPGHDPLLHGILKGGAAHLLHRSVHCDGTFADRLRSVIRARLAEGADQQDVAATLQLTLRGLQRKLQALGLNFRDLVDDERKRQALHRLQQADQSIVDIAASLGFADQSAFSRAFKRWTGCSPSTYRAHQTRHTPPSGACY